MVKKVTFLIPFTILVQCHLLWAYDGDVHYKINESAVQFSQLDSVLKVQLGVAEGKNTELTKAEETKQIIAWIAYGGEAEDFGWYGKYDIPRSRAFNHFHDPLKPWNEAGLDDPFSSIYIANYRRLPVSPILWGLKPEQQDFTRNATGDWS